MPLVKSNLDKLYNNGLVRLWVSLTIIWLIVIFAVFYSKDTFYTLPDKNAFDLNFKLAKYGYYVHQLNNDNFKSKLEQALNKFDQKWSKDNDYHKFHIYADRLMGEVFYIVKYNDKAVGGYAEARVYDAYNQLCDEIKSKAAPGIKKYISYSLYPPLFLLVVLVLGAWVFKGFKIE